MDYEDLKITFKRMPLPEWSDHTEYEVFSDGTYIGKVDSYLRQTSDIRNSVFRRDIKGVREWGGRTADNNSIGYYHETRRSAVMAVARAKGLTE